MSNSSKRFKKGYIGRFWDEEYKNFPFIRQPVTQAEIDEWSKLGYDHVKSYTGMMYDNSNPMPEWTERFKNIFFEYNNLSFTFYKMSTLEIMPTHKDHYRRYCEINEVRPENVVRILVMLEDWKPGHYLEIDGYGITSWIAGDWFMWENDVPHAASNIGVEDRYTLQITAYRESVDKIFQTLYFYNYPDSCEETKTTYDKFVNDRLMPNINKLNPTIVYLLNGNIKTLDTLQHTDEEIAYLNEKGIDIYLLEPICSYNDKITNYNMLGGPQHKHSMEFYTEFTGEEHEFVLRAEELDSILIYQKRNGLTNITVHTCDYDIEKYYYYYKEHIKLICDDWFVRTISPFHVIDPNPSTNFSKKFINLNWRWTPHRHLVAAYLAPMSSYVSWYFRADLAIACRANWFDAFLWDNHIFNKLLEGINFINENAPLNVDFQVKEAVNIVNYTDRLLFPDNKVVHEYKKDYTGFELERFYRDIFCDVVSETRFAQPTGNYSEKVFQAMNYKKPFVLVAPPNTLKYLREEGFKTFSDFWDESYDEELIHARRLQKIFKVIDYINSKDIKDLQKMYIEMEEILQHNYKLMNQKIVRTG